MPPKYVKKDQISHILLRPDTYVGSIRLRKTTEFVYEEGQITKKNIEFSPAILRVFVEALSNALDNVVRSKEEKIPCTAIKVTINNTEISIWNDGAVVPIEIHEEEGCYNHSLIFGQLLTGSNYNDEEERIVSGRNGYGIKLCLRTGTLVPKYDGNIAKVEDIKIGDELIGDDGTRRKVTNICNGHGKMYRITQERGDPYEVNESHMLTLRMPDHKVIFWNTGKGGWSVLWLDKNNKKIRCKTIRTERPEITCPVCQTSLEGNLRRHHERIHKNIDYVPLPRKSPTTTPDDTAENRQGLEHLTAFVSEIPDDNVIDISVKDYMKLPKWYTKRLTGFRGECVKWTEKDVYLDPYMLGLWLGDGSKTGYNIAINAKDDPEILQYIKKWCSQNDAVLTQGVSNKFNWNFSCKSTPGKKYKSPLRKDLGLYDLVENKHIPTEYIVNSRKIRLSLLAGLVDSDGHVHNDGSRITITQGLCNERLGNDIAYLARTLGFMCTKSIKKTQWVHEGELRRGIAILLNISGNDLEDIPTLLPRKKCKSPIRRNVSNNGPISIQQVEDNNYVGIEVDNNHRFVLEDFTVTHNCNIFSSSFGVEGCDPVNGKILTQTWTNNMRKTNGPVIKNTKLKRGYTKVTWSLDFAQFGLTEYTQDILSLYTKYVVDAAMLSSVKVYLNDEIISSNSLASYAKLYKNQSEESVAIKTKNCNVVVTPSDGEFEAISFVNGVYTKYGGVHVDGWAEEIFRPLVTKLSKKDGPKLKITDIKKFFRLFVVSTVVRPEFDGQEKNKLEHGEVEIIVKPSVFTNIKKWSVMTSIEDMINFKDMKELKKVERKKTGRVKVEKLDDANNAGGKNSEKCVLILCEGDSAGAYVVTGIDEGLCGVSGRDWIGVYPLRGKPLNTRNSSPKQITGNKIICNLIQALDLKYDLDYTVDANYKKLRYGKIALATDADVDGIHIEGLVINFIHSLYPSLLERKEPFIYSMKTPIARVKIPRKNDLVFYDERRYHEYLEKQRQKNKKVNAKYFKGLGTISEELVPETFGKKMVQYYTDEETDKAVNKAFHKKKADDRKAWLSEFDQDNYISLDDQDAESVMNVSDFIDGELIKFSHNDCKRSLPHCIDGLKEVQRKILYAVYKRKLFHNQDTLKVAQLGGYVAEHTNYHHGENSIFETIINLAASYVGHNNIPLLYRDGMFGTRLQGGKDAASPRYTFTKMDVLTELIYRPEDNALLDYVIDDGDSVEPYFYVPIIPMILVNGCSGIGTGWSCNIPCYNPLDIIKNVRTWLKNDGEVIFHDEEEDVEICILDELTPWYRGFIGEIEKQTKHKYITRGVIENGPRSTKRVTELPIGMWTQSFKDKCDDLRMDKSLKDYNQYSTNKSVDFLLTEGTMECDIETLKLHSYLHTSNMMMFNTKEQIKKFESPEQILDEFCKVRYNYYIKRKKHLIDSLEKELRVLGNKERFIREVVSGKLEIRNVKENVLVTELEKRKYDKIEDKYEYLLSMQMRSMTAERVGKIKNDYDSKKKILDGIRKTSEKEMWEKDLNELEDAYLKWIKIIEKEVVKNKKKKR